MQSILEKHSSVLTEKNNLSGKILFTFIEWLFRISLFLTIAVLALITVYIFWNGFKLFHEVSIAEFFLSTKWIPPKKIFGILPMIISSFYITIASTLISAPIGITCAVWSSEIAGSSLRKLIQTSVQILAGIPSVVYGLVGFVVITPWIRTLGQVTGYSLLAAIIILSIMILPTIVSISQDAIQSVPKELKQASLALGATEMQTITKVILPVAKPGIITAVVLAISRAFGEAMAVKMVIGSIETMPKFDAESWFGLLSPGRTLTTNIIIDLNYAYGTHLDALFATGAVLFIVIMIVNYFAYILRNHSSKLKKSKK